MVFGICKCSSVPNAVFTEGLCRFASVPVSVPGLQVFQEVFQGAREMAHGKERPFLRSDPPAGFENPKNSLGNLHNFIICFIRSCFLIRPLPPLRRKPTGSLVSCQASKLALPTLSRPKLAHGPVQDAASGPAAKRIRQRAVQRASVLLRARDEPHR